MPPGLERITQGINALIDFAKRNASRLSQGVKDKFATFVQQMTGQLQALTERKKREREGRIPSIPDAARLLWVAAGGNPSAFVNFIKQYPDRTLFELQRSPQRLLDTIKLLSKEMPKGEPTVQDGVPSAWLPSSNIWGFQYDPKSRRLKVKFQGGGIYQYENVPSEIYNIFKQGGIAAKTKGSNQYGMWWVGKRPSLGAAFHQLIKLGGYPHQRLQ